MISVKGFYLKNQDKMSFFLTRASTVKESRTSRVNTFDQSVTNFQELQYVRHGIGQLVITYCEQALYPKLFFLLGLLWSFEGIHAILIRDGPDFENPFLKAFFLTVDVLNLLRGLFIFLIFVCKKKVWSKTRRWWRRERGKRTCSSHPKKALNTVSTFSSPPPLQFGDSALGVEQDSLLGGKLLP